MKKLSLTIVSFLLFFGISFGQDTDNDSHIVNLHINKQALIGIRALDGGTTALQLDPTDPANPGEGISFKNTTDKSLWLNYSSMVASGKTRSITATISSGLPTGTSLYVTPSDATTTNGRGELGDAQAGPLLLSGTASTIVNNIGSCYTGNAPSDGCNLLYTMELDDSSYGQLEAKDYQATVTYTITDQN